MPSSNISFRISLITGVLVIVLSALNALQPRVPACGALAANYPAIIAFELARSTKDLHAIFGDAPSACRIAVAARMDYINWIDTLVFIPLYGAFLLFFFLGVRVRNRRLAHVAAAITIVACLADYVENYCLFHLSAAPDGGGWLKLLMFTTETKWIALGIVGVLGAASLWEGGRWLGWLAGLFCGIGLVASLISLFNPALVGPYLLNAIALGWLTFFAVALGETVYPRLSRTGS